jgi:hypothetical protein
VLVPPHRGQAVIEASGLGDAGSWVPTDRATLQHLVTLGWAQMLLHLKQYLDSDQPAPFFSF